jgi:integrase
MRLTDSKIKSLKPKTSRYIEWDDGCPGLGVRVSTAGRRSFVLMYRFDGRSRMITLGKYPVLILTDARAKAFEAMGKVKRGTDPGFELTSGKKAERDALTVRDLVDSYMNNHAKRKKRSWREDERVLFKDIVPRWGRRKAKSITRLDVVNLLDEIRDRSEVKGGKGVQANRTLEIIRKMFNFAIGRSIIEHSPCLVIERPVKENRRDRVLSEDEIKIFWNNINKSGMETRTRLVLQLQLVTMQRKGELVQIEKNDLDLKSRWWTQPKEKVKNNQAHRVWLTDIAIEIIKKAMELSEDSRWLFPGRVKDKNITPQAIDHALRKVQINDKKRNLVDVFKIPRFTPHDLRRTGATHATGAGVSRFIIGKVLNHVDQSVTSRYDLHEYDAEIQQALQTWGRKLREILFDEKSKVVNMKRK